MPLRPKKRTGLEPSEADVAHFMRFIAGAAL